MIYSEPIVTKVSKSNTKDEDAYDSLNPRVMQSVARSLSSRSGDFKDIFDEEVGKIRKGKR